MMTGLRARYYGHEDGAKKSVESYKEGLPKGMEASKAHIAMILGEPHSTTVKARAFSQY